MQIKGLKRLKTLCEQLNIKYVYEVYEVYEANKQQGEAVITTLERLAKQKTK